jgi:hypothetical protein
MNRRAFTIGLFSIFSFPSFWFFTFPSFWLKNNDQSLLVVNRWILKPEDIK